MILFLKWNESLVYGYNNESLSGMNPWYIRDRSLFMEGGEGNFFFPKFLKLKAPPLKEQKFNDDPPAF